MQSKLSALHAQWANRARQKLSNAVKGNKCGHGQDYYKESKREKVEAHQDEKSVYHPLPRPTWSSIPSVLSRRSLCAATTQRPDEQA